MSESIATVAFADLAGFTALTETHGDHDAVGIVETFEQMARRSVVWPARVVKLIGDAVMLAGPDAGDVVRSVLELARETHATPDFPLLRVGAHEGPVVDRRGDLFGATVNVASRLASIADPGQVLVTRSIAERVRADGIALVLERGQRSLRNVRDPVTVFEVTEAESEVGDWRTDPVCRMRANPPSGVVVFVGDHEVWFCSEECAEIYSSMPENFSGS